MLNLIDKPKIGCDKLPSNSDWLLDSGVTCHMISDLGKLSKAHDIHAILVNMPNWERGITSTKGMVKLNSTITLYDMLFVPIWLFI